MNRLTASSNNRVLVAKSMLLLIIITLPLSSLACSGGEKASSLPSDAPTLSICEAAKEDIGSRIRVKGKFYAFDYGQGMTVVIDGGGLCNESGAGSVFATFLNENEKEKLSSALKGTKVVVEGTIDKIEEDRFVHLSDTLVSEED